MQKNINMRLQKKIKDFYKKYYNQQLNLPNWEEWIDFRLKEEIFERSKFPRLQKILGTFKAKKILDVGCGTGGFLVQAKQMGADVYGIDPDKDAIEICKLKGVRNVSIGKGEALSFKDDFFDIVYCYTVLEHVEDPGKTLSEMIRVAKPSGQVYIHTPNYLSFYEGHYKLFWFPMFPRFLAKIYLVIRKRPIDFLDSINYITPNELENYLLRLPVEFKFIKHSIGNPQNFLEKIIFSYYKLLKIDPQIELVIKKNK